MPSLADLSRRLNLRHRRHGGRGRLTSLLLSDPERLPDPAPLLARLPPGAAVILRAYDDPGRAERAARLAVACRARRLRLLVADDFALAVRLRAGLHLPEHRGRAALSRVRLWRRRGNGPLSMAAHGRAALARAAALGCDAALLSPVFTTGSHPGAPALGLLRLRSLLKGAALPVYALGGLTPTRARALCGCRLAGLAGISGF